MSLETIYAAILNGQSEEAVAGINAALVTGATAEEILHRACIPAMTEVGRLFEIGDKFVPEMLIAARAMQAGLDILKPLLVAGGVDIVGRAVLGTVQGDLHDIGKNLVGMMLEGAGFEVIDLGTDVSAEEFVTAVREYQPDIVGISALLTTTMPVMPKIIEAMRTAGVRRQVKIIVGGAPINQIFAERIGADGYADDASRAARLAQKLLDRK